MWLLSVGASLASGIQLSTSMLSKFQERLQQPLSVLWTPDVLSSSLWTDKFDARSNASSPDLGGLLIDTRETPAARYAMRHHYGALDGDQ